jgi:hypothetical protein
MASKILLLASSSTASSSTASSSTASSTLYY